MFVLCVLISLIKYEVFHNHDSFLQKEQKPCEALIHLESSGNLQWPHVLATCRLPDLTLSVAGREADTTVPFTLPGIADRVLVEFLLSPCTEAWTPPSCLHFLQTLGQLLLVG